MENKGFTRTDRSLAKKRIWTPTIFLTGGMIAMTHTAAAQSPDATTDPRINHEVRTFLWELNKDSSPFWELPGPQVRATVTGRPPP
jgi:hypothetical protein